MRWVLSRGGAITRDRTGWGAMRKSIVFVGRIPSVSQEPRCTSPPFAPGTARPSPHSHARIVNEGFNGVNACCGGTRVVIGGRCGSRDYWRHLPGDSVYDHRHTEGGAMKNYWHTCWSCDREMERCRVVSVRDGGEIEWCCRRCWRELDMDHYVSKENNTHATKRSIEARDRRGNGDGECAVGAETTGRR